MSERNATLSTAVLALCGAMACLAVVLPEIQGWNFGLRLPVIHDDGSALAKEPVSPLPSPKSVLPSKESSASTSYPIAEKWGEKLFTAALTKDFGTVPFGTQLVHRFAITNLYKVPVQITGFRISCACMKAVAGKQILQPGESTTINVTLDTREFTGPRTQTIRVGFDGPYPRTACKLTVSAVSKTDVVFEPDRISFGTVAPGRTAVQSIDVEYKGASPWTIRETIIPKELPLEASVRELARQAGKVRYRLTVKLKDDAQTGRIRDYIYLRTNQTDAPPVAVLVTATVEDVGM